MVFVGENYQLTGMGKFRYQVIIFFVVLLLASCGKISTLPDVPKIEFTSFSVFDTVDILGNFAKGGRLKFYFEDGDGDIGLLAIGLLEKVLQGGHVDCGG